ncbi:MAG: amidotransferase 1, exosortase A system-associated [Rhodobacteraceae bacterium]|nr:amidotransferase 1, exosortase A system-associated [Paracoccaceae bacterium]
MCGIVGLFDAKDRASFDPNLIKAMSDAIAHRGPDGDGAFNAPGVALGHRRLAIIDLAGGAQPMASEDGRTVVVFNGEIYNFQEIAADLSRRGCIFRTHSDTETILHAWRVWGPACVDHLTGMFAFALWDQRDETLFLARDRVGKKPLYYSVTNDRYLAFASEIKSLRVWPQFDSTLDPHAIEDFLSFGYVPDPKSIYANVRKLPPGHTLIWTRGKSLSIKPYWNLDVAPAENLSMGEAIDALHAHLRRAVDRRLISDVPLGAFLSGGVDSSAVVSTMARSMTDPVKTFTIGFGVDDYDETAYAREIASRYRTNHGEAIIDPSDIAQGVDTIDRLIDVYDEPFGDNSAIPTMRVCQEARKRVTVALSGDGGDEAFAGYRRYLWHVREQQVRSFVPSSIRVPFFSTLARIYPQIDSGPRFLRAKSTLRELSLSTADAYFNSVAVIHDEPRFRLYTESFKNKLQGYSAKEVIREHIGHCPDERPLIQAQYVDLKTWLAGRMLVKVDRASMAYGLEVRSPFLDHDLFQWATRLPGNLKLDGGNYKAVLKKALEPWVPHNILYRPKQGFTMPIGQWLRTEWRNVVREALNAPALADCGVVEPREILNLAEEHFSGARNHDAVLWNILIFARFVSKLRN